MKKKYIVALCCMVLAMPCLMFSCLAAMGALVGSPERTSEQRSAKQQADAKFDSKLELYEAWLQMHRFVEDRLKAPATVKWPDDGLLSGHIPEEFTSKIGDGEYQIAAWFDSQNGFGALVRTDFDGRIKKVSDERWQLLELHLHPR